MEFRQLRYFLTIAQMKSYSMAANSLFVTQPTLSWNIQKLEDELNTKLFLQFNQDLKLTKAGELLYEKGQKIIADADQLVQEIQELKSGNEVLKVGLTILFAIQYMEQIVKFKAEHPNVEVSFVQSGSIDIQKKLANKEIDIGLVSYPVYEPDITIESLTTSHANYGVDVVLPFGHPLARQGSIKISDLKDYPICTFSTNYVLGKILRERCAELGFEPDIVFVNDNWEVLLQNTLLTNAITLMPRPLKQLSNFIELDWVPLDDKANEFKIGIAKRKNDSLSEATVQFINHINQN